MTGCEDEILALQAVQAGMIIDQFIWAQNGVLLVNKDQEVTYPVLIHLRNFAKRIGVVEPLRVRLTGQDQE